HSDRDQRGFDEDARSPSCSPYSGRDRKSTRLNSSHLVISYAVFCLKKKNPTEARPEPCSAHPRPPASCHYPCFPSLFFCFSSLRPYPSRPCACGRRVHSLFVRVCPS